jgi:DNA-binding transcriptional ArsR family regulator
VAIATAVANGRLFPYVSRMPTVLKRLPAPDYDADDVYVVGEPDQLRALADTVRMKIVARLRERAASTTELARELDLPKGTVGHHLKVLERAGLIRVVRTRKVRALTEKYYGRVARLFVIKSTDAPTPAEGSSAIAAATLRQAGDEIAAAPEEPLTLSFLHVRLTEADARRFERRLEKLSAEFRAREATDGREYALVTGLYRTGDPRA